MGMAEAIGPVSDPEEFRHRLQLLADRIRATATSGLHWTRDLPYEQERYRLLLEAAAELLALIDTRAPGEILAAYSGELGHQTPKLAVGAIVFDGQGRLLLVRRRDNGLWAVPGGFAEVGQLLGDNVVREVAEETGLTVVPEAVIGLYDSTWTTRTVQHMVNVLFACRWLSGEPRPSYETPEVRFVAEPEQLPLSPGHATFVREGLRWWRGEVTHPHFDGGRPAVPGGGGS